MEKNEVKEFLHTYQYKRKLSFFYFFLTKQGVIFLILAYFYFKFMPFIFAFFLSSWTLWGFYKNGFNYIYTEKKDLYIIKRFLNFIKGVENGNKK